MTKKIMVKSKTAEWKNENVYAEGKLICLL